MIQMCRLKALNQVLITFCQTTILECTLKVVGHFASWSHCAGAGGRVFGEGATYAKEEAAARDVCGSRLAGRPNSKLLSPQVVHFIVDK